MASAAAWSALEGGKAPTVVQLLFLDLRNSADRPETTVQRLVEAKMEEGLVGTGCWRILCVVQWTGFPARVIFGEKDASRWHCLLPSFPFSAFPFEYWVCVQIVLG